MMRCPSKCLLTALLILLCTTLCSPPARSQSAGADTAAEEPPVEIIYEPDEEPEEEDAPRQIFYNQSAPTDAQWQEAAGDKAFGYRNEQEYVPTPKAKEEPQETPWLVKAIESVVAFFSGTTGQVILWVILAAIIGYILYQVIIGGGLRLFGRKDRKPAEAEPEELTGEDLLDGNWEDRLHQALQAGDMRLAVRYSYLHLLQLLQQRDLIAYRHDKTNTEYYRELGGTRAEMRPHFRHISRQYEYAWYGNYVPARADFEAYMQTFNGVKSSLQGS